MQAQLPRILQKLPQLFGKVLTSSVLLLGLSLLSTSTQAQVCAVTNSMITISAATCQGVNDGEAVAQPAGGTAPYTFLWSTGEVNDTAFALAVGINYVTITDNLGCVLEDSVSISANTTINTFTNTNSSSCPACSDGSALAVGLGGSNPITYMWSNGDSVSFAMGLDSGNYSVTVTDNIGCFVVQSLVVGTNVNGLTLSVAISDSVSCNAGSDGQIVATPGGGTPPYSYSWSHNVLLDNDTASNLSEGTYLVTITDNGGVQLVDSATLTEPAAITSSIAIIQDIICFGVDDGEATVTPGGGTPGYSFLWSNGETTAAATSLSAGTNTVTITDNKGCTHQDDVTLASPAAILPTLSIAQSITCNGGNNGSVTSIPVNGTPAYAFNWSSGETIATASGLTEGTYTVTVTDANGCVGIDSIAIADPVPISIQLITVQSPACVGVDDGIVAAEGSNGTAPYSYLWSSGATTDTAFSLSATTHTVTVTDANGCVNSASVTLSPQTSINLFTNTNASTCPACSDGSALAVALGGSNPITYMWSNGDSVSFATGLDSGSYTVTVTDVNGCIATQTLVVQTNINGLSLSLGVTDSIACRGDSTGELTATVVNGNAPISYDWSHSLAANNDVEGSLAAGTYTVTVTDNLGSQLIDSIVLTEPATVFTSSITNSTDLLCFGDADGTAITSSSGGNTPYSFVWSNGETTANASALIGGTNFVTATDSNGCVRLDSVVIVEPTQLVSTDNLIQNVSCFNGNDGAGFVTVSGGTPGYTYLWSNASTNDSISGLVAAAYTVSVTDANGCTAGSLLTISEPSMLTASATASTTAGGTNISCNGFSDGSITLVVSGGTAGYLFSWTGPNGFVSADQNPNSLEAGSYNVTVTDANSCTATESITLTEPNTLTTALSGATFTGGNNISCNGASDGSITQTVSGGSANFSFSWTGPNGFTSSDQNLSSLEAGTYNVTVTDANNCTNTGSITLTEPAVLSATASSPTFVGGNNISCNGANDGSISLAVSGGNTSYSFSWTGPNSFTSSSQNLSSLEPGTYDVTVTDANNCTATESISLTEPAVLTTAASSSTFVGGNNISCNGANDGAITLTVSGGITNYSFSWTGPNSFTSTDQNLINLEAGNYAVTVTDANSCTATESITLTEPAVLTASASSSTFVGGNNISCNGANDGAITLSVFGGNTIYSFSWTGPNSFTSSNQNLNSLDAGTYNVTVTDANSCTATESITLTEPAALTATASSPTFVGGNNISCNGANDGSISLAVSGGNTSYSFSWTGPNSFTSSSQNLSSMEPGTYDVTVTDANNCTATESITLTEPTVLTTSASAPTFIGGNHISCNGASDGAINLSVSGGTTNYSFAWTGPNSFTSSNQNLSNLEAGSYAVTVTDANGCTATESMSLTEPAVLTPSLTSTTFTGGNNISCNGLSDGSISLSVSGGTAGFAFAWTGPNSFASIDQNLSNLEAGTYHVTVTDTNNCTALDSTTLTEPAVLVATASSPTFIGGNNISCNGANDGAINLAVTGGNTSYAFSWTGPNSFTSSSQNLSSLEPGNYAVMVTDANGCTATESMTLTEPDTLTASASSATFIGGNNISCNGASDGVIDLTVAGGNTNYSFSWTGPSGFVSTDEDLMNLVAGTYSVTVSDTNGCTVTESMTLTEPNALTSAISGTNISCNGFSDGGISLTATGGTAGYAYAWTGPSSFASSDQNPINLIAGTYHVTVTDTNGCFETDSIVLTQPLAISMALASPTFNSGDNISCNGLSDGAITNSISGGTSPFTFVWTGPNSFTSADQNPSNIEAGTYHVTATDMNGCSVMDSIALTEPSLLVASAVLDSNVTCFGFNNGGASVSASGGFPTYTYLWSNTATTDFITGVMGGTYSVTVTDSNGCSDSTTVIIAEPNALVDTLASPTFPGGTNISCKSASDGTINLTVNGGTMNYNFAWTGPNSFSSSSQNLSGLDSGTYHITVTDAQGCSLMDSIALTEPNGLSGIATATTFIGGNNVSCNGANDGAINLNVTGGSPGYSYSWTGPNSFASGNQNLSGLLAGMYAVTVTDTNGCVDTTSIVLSEPIMLAATLSSTAFVGGNNISCNGQTDGAINVTVAGGTPGYSYSWTGPNSFTSSIQNLSGLGAGTYTLVLSDTNGCSLLDSITLTEPAVLNAVANSPTFIGGTNISCGGQSDGSINLTISGGTANFSFSWTGPNSFTSTDQNLSGLEAGSYLVTVTDTNGCTTNASIALTAPTPMTASTTTSSFPGGTTISCFGASDGSIDLTAGGGTPGYSYNWSGPSGFTSSDEDLTNLSSGVYFYTVTDTNGCTSTGNVFMTQPGQLLANAAGWLYNGGKNISCNGEEDGQITLLTFGGTSPYTQVWSGPVGFSSTSASLDSLAPATYFVTVTDNQGCTATDSITLTEPDSLKVNIAGSDVSCLGDTNGSVSANVAGGAAPYAYNWNPNIDTVATLNNLGPGSYSVTVTDANGCTDLTSTILAVASTNPVINLGNDTTTMNGDPLLLDPGAGFSQYLWQDGSSNQTFNVTVSGTYWVQVTNANGCVGSDTINVEIGPVGIAELANEVQVKLYPNPTRSDINLEWDRTTNEPGSLQVISSVGRMVHQEPFQFDSAYRHRLQLDNLAAGLYFVRIVNGDQVYTFRIEKQ